MKAILAARKSTTWVLRRAGIVCQDALFDLDKTVSFIMREIEVALAVTSHVTIDDEARCVSLELPRPQRSALHSHAQLQLSRRRASCGHLSIPPCGRAARPSPCFGASSLKRCCAVCSGHQGFEPHCHMAPKCRQQFHLHISRHSHDRLALNCWSRAHTDHDESHVCLRRVSGHVLAGFPVSGCNEGVVLPVRVGSFGVEAVVTPCLSALCSLKGYFFLDAFGNSDFSGLAVWPRIRSLHWWTGLPTGSGPKSARVYCGYRLGPTRVTPPSWQDDGNVRAPALACLVCVAVQVVAVARGWWSFLPSTWCSARTNTQTAGRWLGQIR